jgi:hypothetical protein
MRQVLGAHAVDRHAGDHEAVDESFDKSNFLCVRINNGQRALRMREFDGEAGKSGPGADIDHGLRRADEGPREERIREEFHGGAPRLGAAHEADAPVPCGEEVIVGAEVDGTFSGSPGSAVFALARERRKMSM